MDCTAIAAQLRKNPPALLPFPQQGLVGNCWFLAIAAGLNLLFPRLIFDMVQLKETFAVVSFPRKRPICLSYVLPSEPLTVRLRRTEDLYWALLCTALCEVLFEEQGAKFAYRRLRSGLSPAHPRALFTDAHGGYASDALRILLGSAKGFGTGLLLAEVPRGDGLHSLLILRLGHTSCLAFDPWGGLVEVPRRACALWFYHI
jgi:hypothetical protein